MPYIYTAVRQAYDTGISICRPLYYEWPEENEAYRQEGEYMFGDNILVSPIVTASGSGGRTFHKTWLPDGRWYDVCRNRLIDGGQTISDYYGAEEIPYFVKAGSIVVCNPKRQNLKAAPDCLILKIVPGSDGETSLYEDEGDTQNYERDGYAFTHINQQRQSGGLTVTIDPRQGSYEGMPSARAYELHLLLEESPEQVSVDGAELIDWVYDAEQRMVVVTLGSAPCNQQVVVNLERGASGIENVESLEVVLEQYYDLQGRSYTMKPHGPYIVRRTWSDGSVTIKKELQD